MIFGLILYKSEVVSWYRIQEMFRFQSFHMYGVMGSAIVVGMISWLLVKKFGPRTTEDEHLIRSNKKKFSKGTVIGGLLFGMGWALTGACPGPLFTLVGAGFWIVGIVLLSAILGTWLYGVLQNKLPH